MIALKQLEKHIEAADFVFTDEPRKCAKEDYAKARDTLCEYYSRFPDVLAIYEYGGVRAPGFSDLDIILVLQDNPRDLTGEHLQGEFPAEARYFIGGASKVMDGWTFRKIKMLHHVPNLTRLYGMDLEVEEIPEDLEPWNKLGNVIDFLPTRLLYYFRILLSKVIPVRNVTGVLHSLFYSIKLIEEIASVAIKEGEQYVDRVNTLREKWFDYEESHRQRELTQLLVKGITMSYQLFDELSSFVTSSKVFTSNVPGRAFIQYETGIFFIFSDQWLEHPLVLEGKGNKGLFSRVFRSQRIYLPKFYYGHFAHYAQQRGLMSSSIRKSLYPAPGRNKWIDNELYAWFSTQKMNVCNHLAQFLYANRISQGVFIYKNFLPRKPQDMPDKLGLIRTGLVKTIKRIGMNKRPF